MGTASAVAVRDRAGFGSAEEMREVLDHLLTIVDADERVGPLLRAARIRTRYEFPDVGVIMRVRSVTDDLDRCLEWEFSDRSRWEPRLELMMSSAFANRYLQGLESVPIGLARGKIKCSCESRSALLYLPAFGLLVEPYRRLIADEYPHLVERGY